MQNGDRSCGELGGRVAGPRAMIRPDALGRYMQRNSLSRVVGVFDDKPELASPQKKSAAASFRC